MPEAETTELSVLFFVSVAAEALIRDNDMGHTPFLFSIPLDLTGHTRRHITHHIVNPLFLEAGRPEGGAASTDRPLGFRVGASKFTGRADIEASPASPTVLGLNVKWGPDTPLFPSVPKADGLGHHLFFAHSDAQAAKDAVFVFLFESLLLDSISRGKILNRL
jgi:hypothetical protein